jgi:anti-sigma28 factor (negative regulator of flagellin synthesis)
VATIQKTIREAFLAKLTASGTVDAQKIEQLRALMENGKKLKVDDVVRLFSSASGDGLA